MKYNPKDASMCLPEGVYDATIKAVMDEKDDGSPLLSKAGEKMEKIVFTVYSDEGERTLSDYILERPKIVAWKYNALAKALDVKADFDAGTFDPRNHLGDNLRLQLEVEQYNGQDQNKIAGLLMKDGQSTTKRVTAPRPAQPAHARKEIAPEDIPF